MSEETIEESEEVESKGRSRSRPARPRGRRPARRGARSTCASSATRSCGPRRGPVDRFDDALRDEVARMGTLMHDAMGIGLAATQVGVLHRVLVYRVEHDSPVNALVNPEIEWSSKDKEIIEEGCLSLPGVHVDVERPIHVRVAAQDEHGRADPHRGVGAGGAGHPARDRPPRRRADPRPHLARPAQGSDARAARGARRRLSLAYLGTSEFAVGVLRRRLAHARTLVVTRPDRPAGRGRKLSSPPVAERRASWGSSVDQPRRRATSCDVSSATTTWSSARSAR